MVNIKTILIKNFTINYDNNCRFYYRIPKGDAVAYFKDSFTGEYLILDYFTDDAVERADSALHASIICRRMIEDDFIYEGNVIEYCN